MIIPLPKYKFWSVVPFGGIYKFKLDKAWLETLDPVRRRRLATFTAFDGTPIDGEHEVESYKRLVHRELNRGEDI